MRYSAELAIGLPHGDLGAFKLDGRGKKIRLFDTGGSSAPAPAAPTSQTVTQTNLPEYARPYVETLLGKAQALTDTSQNPYQQYGGQRIAGFTPMQEQSFQNIGNMSVAPQIGQASQMAGAAGLGGLGAQGQAGMLGGQALGKGE